MDFDSRIEQVFTWLDMPADDRPQLITLYFNEPDSRGHTYGPFSTEVTQWKNKSSVIIVQGTCLNIKNVKWKFVFYIYICQSGRS